MYRIALLGVISHGKLVPMENVGGEIGIELKFMSMHMILVVEQMKG